MRSGRIEAKPYLKQVLSILTTYVKTRLETIMLRMWDSNAKNALVLDLPQVSLILSQALWVKNLQKATYFG